MNKWNMKLVILILSLIILLLMINNLFKKELYFQTYDRFIKKYILEMEEIVSKLPFDVIITGSGALALLLYKLEMFDELEEMIPPGDLDLIYIGKGSDFFIKNRVGKFQRMQKSPGRSVSFILEEKDEDFDKRTIKSFDLTMLNQIDNIDIDSFKVITPTKLLYFYEDEDDPVLIRKNENKIYLLKKIIQKINNSPTLRSKFLSKREKKRLRESGEDLFEKDSKRINF